MRNDLVKLVCNRKPSQTEKAFLFATKRFRISRKYDSQNYFIEQGSGRSRQGSKGGGRVGIRGEANGGSVGEDRAGIGKD